MPGMPLSQPLMPRSAHSHTDCDCALPAGAGVARQTLEVMPRVPRWAVSAFTLPVQFSPGGIYTAAEVQGLRGSRASWRLASRSPTKRSRTGSHFSGRPSREAITPRWQTVAERWPISASQMGG